MSCRNCPSFKKKNNIIKKNFCSASLSMAWPQHLEGCELNSQHFTEHNGHKNKIDKHSKTARCGLEPHPVIYWYLISVYVLAICVKKISNNFLWLFLTKMWYICKYRTGLKKAHTGVVNRRKRLQKNNFFWDMFGCKRALSRKRIHTGATFVFLLSREHTSNIWVMSKIPKIRLKQT